jgi:signal transduction histidine kinase
MPRVPVDPETALQELDEARRRTAALAQFARRTAHDLSNFLTVIRTYSELLLADLPAEDPSRADLNEIAQAAETTVRYVQRTAAFSRAESARSARFALDELVRTSLGPMECARLGPLEVQVESHADVVGPVSLLSETLHELVANAREASGSAVVHVHAGRRSIPTRIVSHGIPVAAGEWAVVEIRDQGPGIAPELEAELAEPFVTSKRGVRGAGLGLTIARSTVWAAGGALTVGREGEQTVARLYLPIASEGDPS